MIRGTTPTIVIGTDMDLSSATAIYITFSQYLSARKEVVRVDRDISNIIVGSDSISCTLSQAETLAFSVGDVEVQIRAKFSDGSVVASNIMTATMAKALKDEVI